MVNNSCSLFPPITLENSATSMIAHHVVWIKGRRMLSRFGQVDGTIVEWFSHQSVAVVIATAAPSSPSMPERICYPESISKCVWARRLLP